MAEIKKAVEGYEASVLKLSKGWPTPFLDMVDVFLKRIPSKEDADKKLTSIADEVVCARLRDFIHDVKGIAAEVTGTTVQLLVVVSIIALSRAWALLTACMSPVRWRLRSSIGRTCE